MIILRILDRVVRILAAISAIAVLPIVLVLAVMANDSGSSSGALAARVVLAIGTFLSLWVLLCSVAPALVARWLKEGFLLCVLIIKLPVYATAIAGIYILVSRVMDRPDEVQLARNSLATQCENDEVKRLQRS